MVGFRQQCPGHASLPSQEPRDEKPSDNTKTGRRGIDARQAERKVNLAKLRNGEAPIHRLQAAADDLSRRTR